MPLNTIFRLPPAHACASLWVRKAIHALGVAAIALMTPVGATAANADDTIERRALTIEAALTGFPQRSAAELVQLIRDIDVGSPGDKRLVYGLFGQARVLSGDPKAAALLADQLEMEATSKSDLPGRATALLIRSAIESSAGDTSKAASLARQARDLVRDSDDEFIRHWAALALGTSTRTLGQAEEALASLQQALSSAERARNPYRRSNAYYQLSVLQRSLKNGTDALAASVAAFKYAEAANSAFAMASAKMAESAVMELLVRPVREMSAIEQALAIARDASSQTAESRVLV
ncbi:MAG: hypothetical protein ABI777_08145, partial [Betaproteobacteria bacterium]